ncbi:MAG TPA: sigma-70 family RNA polymerase sigma factor [Solirubrobacteraceae bacterium]|nr:sigma-70 family RNA polymerase sigma factor [Solirubrobacteraceae bacterium]
MAATDPTTDNSSLRSPDEARELVLDVLRDNADSLLGVARRHSLCLDDAQDAYQRALEIFLRHAHRLEADGAPKWVHTVTKHEAMRLRTQRQRQVSSDEIDFDSHEARHLPDAEDRVIAFDRVTRSAEALQRLKPQELRALWLQAQGLSYQEIAEHCDWTYTKVNRCITEGRRSFLAHYAGIEAGEECRRWSATLSALVDGEASAQDLATLRPHLRNCAACRATVRELHGSRDSLAAVLPLPVAAAAIGVPSEPVTGLVSRAWEVMTMHLHERAVGSALKLQTAFEAATTGKAAAVAASAAALAGGGVAVDHAVGERTRGAGAVTTTPAVARSAAASRSPQVRPAVSSSAATVEFSLATSPAVGEFDLDGAAATRASASSAKREFDAMAGARTVVPSPARERAAGAAPAGDAGRAAAEFGP